MQAGGEREMEAATTREADICGAGHTLLCTTAISGVTITSKSGICKNKKKVEKACSREGT